MVHGFLHRNILGVDEFGKTYLDKSNLWAKKTKKTSLLFAFGARSNYLDLISMIEKPHAWPSFSRELKKILSYKEDFEPLIFLTSLRSE
ncbi:unnamed protein product [Brassica rapa]|uniref:Uncharacterized protein n=1 Tax=Brassica campestris TaxID=3711 RepID=A0A3P5ZMP2_BRACM|nr:unnamed protein product [Brassica rapa]VDC76714.1 unnamed protein product [Brassica rapa]